MDVHGLLIRLNSACCKGCEPRATPHPNDVSLLLSATTMDNDGQEISFTSNDEGDDSEQQSPVEMAPGLNGVPVRCASATFAKAHS